MVDDASKYSIDDESSGEVFNPEQPRPREDVQGERRSITAIGRKDHIYRSSVPEKPKPAPAAPAPVRANPSNENVRKRSDREAQTEESFGGFLEGEKKKEAVTNTVVLKVVLFLVAASALSVGLASVILGVMNK